MNLTDKKIMLEVLRYSRIALDNNELPIACIITKDDQILSKAFNQKEGDLLSVSHAEILAIKEASKKINNWRLNKCKIYVNLEPCLMCLGAILESRISELIFATYDYNMGGIYGRYGIGAEKIKFTNLSVKTGICMNESKMILRDFFRRKRIK